MANYGGWERSDFPADDTDEWKRRLVGVEKEQHTLQAKSDLEKPHLTKMVSALANSRGGVLLVGVATEDANDAITGIPGMAREITDQWVENVVKTGVEPCPSLADYHVHATPGEVSGQKAYAVFVPESAGGPHQDVKTGIYWNIGIQGCVQMTDRQIRDAMGRGQKPEFVIEMKAAEEGGSGDSLNLNVSVNLGNHGRGSGRDVLAILRIPNELPLVKEHKDKGTPFRSVATFERGNQVREWPVGSVPPGLERCGRIRMRIPDAHMKTLGEGRMVVEIYADNQLTQTKTVEVRLHYPELKFAVSNGPNDGDAEVCWKWLGV